MRARHRLCQNCSTAIPEAAEHCTGCGAALIPVAHPRASGARRSWKWRIVDFIVTGAAVFFAAMALQHYYLGGSESAATRLTQMQKAALAQMSAEARGDLLLGTDLCGYGLRDPLEALMGRLARLPEGPVDQATLPDAKRAALLARCAEFGAQLRGLGLVD